MSTALSEAMRQLNAGGHPDEAILEFAFVHDPGVTWLKPAIPTDEEVFQLIAALVADGFTSLAEDVLDKYADRHPQLTSGEMGGDVQRVLSIAHIRAGNIDEAADLLDRAFGMHYKTGSSQKLVLDKVVAARLQLRVDDGDKALHHIWSAYNDASNRSTPGPISRHVNYWLSLIEITTIGRLPITVVDRVAEEDRALHRRQTAKQLRNERKAKHVADRAIQHENVAGRGERRRESSASAHGVYF